VSLDPKNHFEILLNYFYEEEITIDRRNCISLRHLGLFFGCDEIVAECDSYYAHDLYLKSAFNYIIEAQDFCCPEIISVCSPTALIQAILSSRCYAIY